jgi:hypothetical protein
MENGMGLEDKVLKSSVFHDIPAISLCLGLIAMPHLISVKKELRISWTKH